MSLPRNFGRLRVDFPVADSPDVLQCDVERPELLFGATFLLVAPSHPMARRDTAKPGSFTGVYATNPANRERIPVWVADAGWSGPDAAVAVPAHDTGHQVFAKEHGLPGRWVIDPSFVRDDAKDKTVFKRHRKIVAVVENDQGDILTINWGPKYGGRLTIGGTVEGDEAPETTALREVAEETGYTDLELVEVGPETVYYKYYAFSKGEAHDTAVRVVHLRLRSDARRPQNLDESEQDKFTVEWVSRAVAEREITEPLHRYALDKFIAGACYKGEGVMVNAGRYSGTTSADARQAIADDLTTRGVARAA